MNVHPPGFADVPRHVRIVKCMGVSKHNADPVILQRRGQRCYTHANESLGDSILRRAFTKVPVYHLLIPGINSPWNLVMKMLLP